MVVRLREEEKVLALGRKREWDKRDWTSPLGQRQASDVGVGKERLRRLPFVSLFSQRENWGRDI